MDQPNNKKFANLSAVKSGHNEYLKLLKSIPPVSTVKDDMRHLSVQDMNNFMVRINFWNLNENNKSIVTIGIYSTYDKTNKQTSTALIPLDIDGKPVMSGPSGPADGPSYIS